MHYTPRTLKQVSNHARYALTMLILFMYLHAVTAIKKYICVNNFLSMPFQLSEFNEQTLVVQTRVPESLYYACIELAMNLGLTKSRFFYIVFLFGLETFNRSMKESRLVELVENLEKELKPEQRAILLKRCKQLENLDLDEMRDAHKLDEYFEKVEKAYNTQIKNNATKK